MSGTGAGETLSTRPLPRRSQIPHLQPKNHNKEGMSTKSTQQALSSLQSLLRCIGVKARKGFGFIFAEILSLMQGCVICYVIFEMREDKNKSLMSCETNGFGPGGDTSIPPVPRA